MFENIKSKELKFKLAVCDKKKISNECFDIVIKFLKKNPEERLGSK
jgi:hypothetical protein